MKIRKEPIREDRYLNVKLDTYPIDFTILDSLFYDLGKFSFCIVITDGEKEVFLEYASSKPEALKKHKEYYERLILRPPQWYDVRKKKFFYLKYNETPENINDIVTINEEELYAAFVKDVQQLIVNGSNNGLTFYTKREATDYSRKVAFAIFSGLRVKIGQLRNTSYADLKQSDARVVDSLVKQTDRTLAERFMNTMYKPGTEEQESWEMFVDLVEAKISEYYREETRDTSEVPNYIILDEILTEVHARVSLTRKPDAGGHGDGGGADHAEWEKRFANNAPGKFYVDEKCIVCDACAATAPKFFVLNEQHAYLITQPTTPEEIEQCNQALAGCPVAAIGNDGDIKAAQAAAPPAKAEVAENAAAPVKAESAVAVKQPEAIKPEQKEKELEELRSLLGTISDDKLLEIKALLKDATLDQQKAALEAANAAPAAAHPAPAEAMPVEEAPSPGGAKPLPATSPNGSNVYPENVPGLFYVDENCIECDACTSEAPNFFVIENGHAHVFAQPFNDKEIAECEAAQAGCPVDAIHKNL
jgi:ferredoxin